MSADLELSVLLQARADRGFVAGFAVTDEMIMALGGLSEAMMLASSNARDFAPRKVPYDGGLRDALAVADSIWVCGEFGLLAVSRDHGETWKRQETGTQVCLFGLALGADGAVWVVGDEGYVARVLGQRVQRIDFRTAARMSAVYAVRDEIVALGFDGQLWRWRDGKTIAVPCGATAPLTALAISGKGTWIVTGDGGFVARSPDGQWYARAASGVEVDLEAVVALPDGSLIAVGGQAQILRSLDDGRTWSPIAHRLGASHLWSVERFGEGVLIGGDDGLVIQLAPPGDVAWRERADVFGGTKPLDAAFAPGPDRFVTTGLAVYLDEIAVEGAADEPLVEELALGGDDEPDDDDDIAAWADEDGDAEAARLLAARGDAASFRTNYGMPLPPEAVSFFDAVAHRDPWTSFAELRLDAEPLPDVGEQNLFELILRRNQHAYLGTDLVEAFCGVFAIGSQGNGDAYLLELYEWDGPRQVLHYDHETHSISKYVADSLDSLVYFAALVKSGDEQRLSKEAYQSGLRRLHGRVSPTWHFEIEERDPAFVHYEPKRRDTEFFFYRSRWITAFLKNDGVTELRDLPNLFMADFNQVVPPDQLAARFDACEKFIPTALYAMWRAYLFGEPELVRYLEIGRGHRARLVRDAATLIGELRDGRNELGSIRDVRSYIGEFRALDLDPRRADDRKTEADVRAKAEAARRAVALRELDETPPERWPELAWQWLGDGVAHRALLERVDELQGEQIAALDELRMLRDDERAVALPRLAAELSPELEAVLAGSLVRNDPLEGVLERPAPPPPRDDGDRELDEEEDADADEDDDGGMPAPGWDAIDAALRPIYGDTEPLHYGTVLPAIAGGDDPIHGVSVFERADPVPHWHFITYGFTDLFQKETDDPDESGFGFELTLRLARRPDEDAPPPWALDFLQNLGRYVLKTGNAFAAGHKMSLDGPIALDTATQITAVCFADDPELGAFSSELGRARFVQVVGITADEFALTEEWSTAGLIDVLRERVPYLVTDLARPSVLADPATAAEIARRTELDGDEPPDAAKVAAALAMSNRALRLAPDDAGVQYTHAMLLLDAEHAGLADDADELFAWLPRCTPEVRLRVAVQLSRIDHERFADAADLALDEALPTSILATTTTEQSEGGVVQSFGEVAHELLSELGAALLERAPELMPRLVPLLPDEARLLGELAAKSQESAQPASARALHERMLALPIPPEPGEARDAYLEAMHDAAVHARVAKEYDTAIRIADRTQTVADENPHLYHAAASAYAAIGDLPRAFAQVKLAVQHDYHHLDELEVDPDLGPLLEWPEFKALFREWRVRREGN